MHETDAMQFIEPVLTGFFERNFQLNESEDSHFVELCLDEVLSFIQDKEPYWVKEKSLRIIENIEAAENQIRTGLYNPATPGDFLTTVLSKVRKRFEEEIEFFREEQNRGKTRIYLSLPSFSR